MIIYICTNRSVKTRYFIFISYKGTCYHGWQVQPNSVTVQKILDDALSLILGEKIVTTGAGRTDTGVHARIFCAHFDTVSTDLAVRKNLEHRLNRFLPEDISVTAVRQVVIGAHARYSAISRTYKYYITRTKDPFRDDSSWLIGGHIDIESMKNACNLLSEYTDFTSFCKMHSNVKTNTCKIYHASWEEEGTMMVFTIKADRFLRNMVRAIVGTMVEIGLGKKDLNDFVSIILAKDRSRAGKSAPAKGLFLTGLEYPEEIFV